MILVARRVRRRAERKWIKSSSETDHTAFKLSNRHVNEIIVKTKQKYIMELLCKASAKTVFQTINNLLHKNVKVLPMYENPTDLANRFALFFVNKISDIHNNVTGIPPRSSEGCRMCNTVYENDWNEFETVSEDNIKRIIIHMSNATSMLDAQPTWLLKKLINCNVPALTCIVNSSLASGIFPEAAHEAVVVPIIKKLNLDKDTLRNYRPVSNLSHVAKLIEKVVAIQLTDHLNDNSLYDPMQSAYRSNFSTETALLKLQNDVLTFFDQRRSVFLVLLDISAAFDTVDHVILLNRLESRFHISGVVLSWMKSYLTGWSSRVNIAGELSDPWVSDFGVPQGSVLGPILFSLYITPISDIINKYGLQYICYADDIQLFTSFDPRSLENINETLHQISLCIAEISTWMSSNYLQLNNNKTEFMAFCSSAHHLQYISDVQLKVNNQFIPLSPKITDLGVCIDNMFKLTSHVNQVVRNSNFHLRNLWRIRRFIDLKTCHHAARALIISR